MKKITKSKSIYTLTKPVWRDSAGLNKGLYHDKQHLGIILAAGEVLKIRQTNNKFNSWLSGHLLTDDSKTEQRFSLGTDWIEISSYTDSVPFIDTPYIDGSPQVTFEYAIDSKILPVLGEGENEEDFFQSWESQDAEYGLLEGEFNRLLVPRIDRYELKKAGPTELFAYYRRIFNLYNSLAGLSFDPWPITDRNSKNRYFMKADKNGVGVGYYGQFWTAESSSSMRSFWLTPEDNNWGSLH